MQFVAVLEKFSAPAEAGTTAFHSGKSVLMQFRIKQAMGRRAHISRAANRLPGARSFFCAVKIE
jgi:hypothetical protein